MDSSSKKIDSWWYFKGPFQGVTQWTPMTDLFPNGLNRVQQESGWSMAAHNRFWSGLTHYATQNGGEYDFVIGTYLHETLTCFSTY